MELFFAIFLGIVQGITEFLPISSSGHLILARDAFGVVGERDLAVDALLHFASAAGILIYFRKDFHGVLQSASRWLSRELLEEKDRVLLYALVLGTLPAVLLGVIFEDAIESTLRNASSVAGALVAGSVLMFLAERTATHNKTLSARMGLRIGFFQALALIPGMSRSGMAISGGLILGLTRENAARFAFMLGLPILIGVGTAKALELYQSGVLLVDALPLGLSVVTAFLTGLLTIHYLLKFLRSHSLNIFILYRIALAALIFVLL